MTRVHVPAGQEAPEDLMSALSLYEAALAQDDLDVLGRFFVDGPDALRGDAGGLLVGREQIDRFRGRRGGAGRREVTDAHVRMITEADAWVTTVNAPDRGGRGIVTQLWRRTGPTEGEGATPGGWVIHAAQVAAPAAAFDTRVWRTLGNPLAPGARSGPLAGHTVAVKDVFAVVGQAVGGGVPAYLAESDVEEESADAVAALTRAGASVTGIAQTDQFAYSIAGINAAYGTPPNVAAPGAVPGGSSSGPASAVAQGQASIGLGTDTAGSIRVPASYQGLWGLRPTHGLVSLRGALPLAPSYDTAGWLARDGETLLEAARASLDPATQRDVARDAAVVSGPVFLAADDEVALALGDAIDALSAADVFSSLEPVNTPAPEDLFRIFRYTQSAEAARSWQAWIDAHPGALAVDVADRFAWAAGVTAEEEAGALEAKAEAREALDRALGDDILLLPSASSVAPALDASPERLQAVREATLGMTAIAGITGRPALSVPLVELDEGPVGLCLVGPRGSDLALIETAIAWLAALKG
ncbi:AtzH-like domain-containing protein [Demequina sp. NBRC 110057]|uniref:AtzH-like domain-containing protein n=1 Tax=Demequina sp. NBRC 110057 TaxID=1570346 RepID=UPI000A0242CC|nr:AtzH-like domain-containing protein [Demequina sp. NBRC 110057]